MFILVNHVERAMDITFNDIQQRHKELQDKYSDRKFELQELGRKLVVEYIDSLSLPSQMWIDASKVQRQYVTIGEYNDKKLFEQKPIAGFNLDNDYKLKFKISTVIDDSEYGGGAYYLVSVALWKDSGRIHVDIGDGKKTVLVPNPEEEGAFIEVCSTIKQLILSGFTDPRLD
ncbi:hypothetical protein DFO55_13714 [Grimontella sp. AG753]|nr:hypothetical protein DFO55_13714 [Grimontella sp. AG753]